MDESLDDYISKSNFKIKIGNSKPKGNLVNKPNVGGGLQSKKRFTGGFQGNKVTDVSITVPAVEKTRPNNNRTNQMRDARERLVSKNKPVDAREKLNQKAQSTDARQKLMTIRSQKEPQDARAKIQAKKKFQANQPQSKDGAFTLTRTVSNNNNNNIQLTPGPRGDIHITKTLQTVHHAPVLPRVQVQNDQYRPPEPQYTQYAPPPQHYAPPPQQYAPPQPQYVYPQSQQQVPYELSPQETITQSTARIPSDSNSVFKRTIVNDVPSQRDSVSQNLPLKRKLPTETQRQSSSAGPLRLSSSNYVPVIELAGSSGSTGSQKPKLTKISAPGEPVAKRLKDEATEDENVISPIQGFKVSITNLALSVTQDDIIELFGAIGAVKSVKLMKPGTAEVIYVKKDIASQAIKSYHDRELDGQPMVVKLVTPLSARIKEAPEKLPPSIKPVASSPLKFSKGTTAKGKAPDKKEVDVQTLHKALFKTGSAGASRPVTFTVNI